MTAGLARSLACRALLASRWKAWTPPHLPTTLDAPTTTTAAYSSIADAMLGRAASAHAAAKPKTPPEKQPFPSSIAAHNGNIEEQFKKARSTQSIGGFTSGVTNKFAKPAVPPKPPRPSDPNPLASRSSNIRQPLQRVTSTFSTASSSLSAVFSSTDSFRDNPESINLTGDMPPTSKFAVSRKQQPAPSPAVEFDENDFDDDDEIDIDFDYALPMSTAVPSKPTSSIPEPSPYKLPAIPCQKLPQQPTSSAQTWSSSSPSHKRTPPRGLKRKSDEDLPTQTATEASVQGPEPRQTKRRTLYFLQGRAENSELLEMQDEQEEAMADSSSTHRQSCFKCNEPGHYAKDCKKKGSKFDFTPKEKRMPWNSTGSAIAEDKKRHKEKMMMKTRAADGPVGGDRAKQVAMAPVSLSSEQKTVLDLVVNQSKSVFFTGSAGTGKSVLMRAIIAELRKKYVREPDRIAVTASTGLAACNIGGVTLHSFGGIGLGKEDVPVLVKKIRRNAKAKNRWIRTKILVIDEISMVDGDLFDKLEGIARAMRNNGRPFGGIQLVITGDFFQLPPVPDYDNKARGVKFAFDAGTWSTAIHHTIGLTEVFRQKDPGTSFLSSTSWERC